MAHFWQAEAFVIICGFPWRADHKRAILMKWIILVDRFSMFWMDCLTVKESLTTDYCELQNHTE